MYIWMWETFNSIWGSAYHRGSILASHPAAPGSNSVSAKIFLSENFSLFCLVRGQYWQRTHLVLCNGFHKSSQWWRPELSTTKISWFYLISLECISGRMYPDPNKEIFLKKTLWMSGVVKILDDESSSSLFKETFLIQHKRGQTLSQLSPNFFFSTILQLKRTFSYFILLAFHQYKLSDLYVLWCVLK